MVRNSFSTAKRVTSCFSLALLFGCKGGEIEKTTEEMVDDEPVADKAVVVDTWDEGRFFDEFAASKNYGYWDLNKDKHLSEVEFTSSFNNVWDVNGEGRVSQSEWETAISDFGVKAADWTAWNTDGDGYMETAEFEADFAQIGWFSTWDQDKDNLVTEQEYTAGVYQLWDTDGDNQLDRTEYTRYNKYYGR
ncbi:hypothetical protein ACFSRY_18970 [Pontibacter locisalis]|uniref:EF hand n=1 Tax=Pontibacter locisalis TaxID=1719035 RepID=A0ABW5IQL9_9BACT